MLLLRAAFLGFALCFHVIGVAVLFRRFFPRESPWLCYIVPILFGITALNFMEHYVPLSNLGWLLPFTFAGLFWAMVKPGYSWQGLRLPTVFFLVMFAFIFFLRCLSPVIPNYTEGIFNLTRIVNYDLSTTLPPNDCWLPPYHYGGYYTFQHYGASVLKRLFSVDVGTAYNLSFAFLLTWLCLAGVGVAHSISGKTWIAVATAVVLLAGSTGMVPLLIFFGHHGADYEVATSINDCWNDHDRNPLWWFSEQDKDHPTIKLLPPTYTLYYSEYHANLGGAFITIVSILACFEIFKLRKSNWPWICLVALPWLAIITSAWFFFIVFFICTGSLVLALLAGRRPEDVRFALGASAVALVCIWPSFYSLSGNPVAQSFYWTTPEERTPIWMFTVLWWPVWLPWLFLCFVWHRLDLACRWIHAAIPIMLIAIEIGYFASRALTYEKMWGGIYGIGLVTLLPMLFMQKGLTSRILSGFLILIFALCFGDWMTIRYHEVDPSVYFRLQGDSIVQGDHQQKRLLQVLKEMHGAVVLPGKSYWDYNAAPAVVAFSENYCYVAYTFSEEEVGMGEEAKYRDALNNSFYDGKMAAPLPFLRSNNIAAVLIWPEDDISDDQMQKFQQEIGSDYYYINCKMDEPKNAGVFVRQSHVRASNVSMSTNLAPLDLGPTPNP